MTVVCFTIPVRFYEEPHPFGCTPDDWFEVHVGEGYSEVEAEVEARMLVNFEYGNHVWCSTFLLDEFKNHAAWLHGECKRVLTVPEVRR